MVVWREESLLIISVLHGAISLERAAVSDKGGGKAAFSGFGTRDGAMARAPGPSQREIGRWNPSRVV